MSACKVSYRIKRSGPMLQILEFFFIVWKKFFLPNRYILVNCYNIYYIDSILENAKRKSGKHGQTGSRTRTKGTSIKHVDGFLSIFNPPSLLYGQT